MSHLCCLRLLNVWTTQLLNIYILDQSTALDAVMMTSFSTDKPQNGNLFYFKQDYVLWNAVSVRLPHVTLCYVILKK